MDIFKLAKMIVLGTIINGILIGLLYIFALMFLSPILIGLIIVLIINCVSQVKRKKFAHGLWHAATAAVVIVTTGMLWADFGSEAVNFGSTPFLILLLYGVGSLAGYAIPAEVFLQKKERGRELSWEELPEETRKRKKISRIVAIGCAVMAGIGALVSVIEYQNIGESLPPTIMFAIAAIVCWVIAKKKHYASGTEAAEKPIPPTFSGVVRKEHREFFGEESPEEYIQAVYDDYPALDYDATYTYCQVALDDSGRTYYYRTRDPELTVGDAVYVPFGDKAPKRIGVIISKEDFVGYAAPFPLERTKYIIGRVE